MPDLPEPTPKPCNDCPWRREAAAGWLGPYDAVDWLVMAHGEEAIACHCTIEQSGDWGTSGIRQCRGAAIYRANNGKSPRDPKIATGPEDLENVFAKPNEFLSHHERREIDAAEAARLMMERRFSDG